MPFADRPVPEMMPLFCNVQLPEPAAIASPVFEIETPGLITTGFTSPGDARLIPTVELAVIVVIDAPPVWHRFGRNFIDGRRTRRAPSTISIDLPVPQGSG